MRVGAVAAAAICLFAGAGWSQESPATPADREAAAIIARFERALQGRDVPGIAELVADDIVVFENGHRNDGWTDFRDNHLIPEMKEAAPPMKSQLPKMVASPAMAWGYTRTDIFRAREGGQKATHRLWSVYILEKREGTWKITMLDWSIAKLKG
jgi:ketosteroid isomerase-like protein